MGLTRAEHLLVAVIGNSDVQTAAEPTRAEAGDETGKSDRGARRAGETLLRRLDAGETVAHDIPLLPPIVRFLERQGQRPDHWGRHGHVWRPEDPFGQHNPVA